MLFRSDVPENFKFCKENELCKLLSYKGKVFSVEIPNFIELEVTQTEPGVKGNTATNTCLLYTSTGTARSIPPTPSTTSGPSGSSCSCISMVCLTRRK